ncbi:MAG TPA: GNAT family N-acetyltransferase [Ramlibacter sp.]|nr:GNAT family N-acetyltransferase [Ramlibacter sp.]
MTNADVESIERATLAAVAPTAFDELEGWLLPFDSGVVGRAKSAVPLRHDHSARAPIAQVESRYAAKGLPVLFRIAEAAALAPLRDELTGLGYRHSKPTLVQVAGAQAAAEAFSGPLAEVTAIADDDWTSVFLGDGFDPVEGASRVQTLRRADGSLFARVRGTDGKAVAAGVLALGHGWASIHGMRTAQSQRGRGLAKRVVSTLARAALDKGFESIVLQVQADNLPAQRLYARCGFTTAWTYNYWQK